MKRSLLAHAGIALALSLSSVSPAAGAIVRVSGSVKAPLGDFASPEGAHFAMNGCAPNYPDGVFGAYIDVRGYTKVTVRVTGADVGTPMLGMRLWPTCASPALVGYTGYCFALYHGSCTLEVNGKRYLELNIGVTLGADRGLGAKFTVDLIRI